MSLHGSIIFHFHLCFSPLDSILLIDRNQVGKEQRIGTLSTVFRLDSDEQKVDNLGFMELDGAQQMPPAKRKQPAPMTLLQSSGKGRHRNTDTYHLMILSSPVFYGCYKVQVEQRQIHLDVLVYLLL